MSSRLREELEQIVGVPRVFDDTLSRFLYSYDASMERAEPEIVVRPRDRRDLIAVVRTAIRHSTRFVVRGAGTGYSGGALAARGGVIIVTTDLVAITRLDVAACTVWCEPGVVLADLQRRVAEHGLRYLPDPSSHMVCTIGGNVAENAGGPHALGFGPTANFVICLEVLMPDGEIKYFHEDDPAHGRLDFRALLVGSEGTLGVVLSVMLRLQKAPPGQRLVVASFATESAAVDAVEWTLKAGLAPTALDMLSGSFVPALGRSIDESTLFVDFEGAREDVEAQTVETREMYDSLGAHAEILRLEDFLVYRAELVRQKVRRMTRATGMPRYYLFDCVAPRGRLRDLMDVLRDAATAHDLPLGNTFHAGDGNVHPTPYFDPEDATSQARLMGFLADVLRECARMGGAASGEHGIGLEKRSLAQAFLRDHELVRAAEIKEKVDPEQLCNPGKALPAFRENEPCLVPDHALATGPVAVDTENGLIVVSSLDVTFADCERALEGTPFEFAYEPIGCDPTDSVLSAIDSGRPGYREPRLMRARDLIVNVATERSGAIERFGRLCAKDVTGYELRKLAYGGRGRIGRLVEVAFRLAPRPKSSLSVQMDCDADEAQRILDRIANSELPVSTLVVDMFADRASLVLAVEGVRSDVSVFQDEIEKIASSATITKTSRDDRAWWGWIPGGLADPIGESDDEGDVRVIRVAQQSLGWRVADSASDESRRGGGDDVLAR